MNFKILAVILAVACVVGSAFVTKRNTAVTPFGYVNPPTETGSNTRITVINPLDVTTEFCNGFVPAVSCRIHLDLNDWSLVGQSGNYGEIEIYQIPTSDLDLGTNTVYDNKPQKFTYNRF